MPSCAYLHYTGETFTKNVTGPLKSGGAESHEHIQDLETHTAYTDNIPKTLDITSDSLQSDGAQRSENILSNVTSPGASEKTANLHGRGALHSFENQQDRSPSPVVAQLIVYGFKREQMVIEGGQNGKEMLQMSVLQLKEKIAEKFPGPSGLIMSHVKLSFENKRLDDDSKLLPDYGIGHKSVIQMVMSLDGGMAA